MPAEPLCVLRAVMGNPEALKTAATREELTEDAARQIANLALALRDRGHHAEAAAHFRDTLLFRLFAEDAGLIPKGVLGRLAAATNRSRLPSQSNLGSRSRSCRRRGAA